MQALLISGGFSQFGLGQRLAVQCVLLAHQRKLVGEYRLMRILCRELVPHSLPVLGEQAARVGWRLQHASADQLFSCLCPLLRQSRGFRRVPHFFFSTCHCAVVKSPGRYLRLYHCPKHSAHWQRAPRRAVGPAGGMRSPTARWMIASLCWKKARFRPLAHLMSEDRPAGCYRCERLFSAGVLPWVVAGMV